MSENHRMFVKLAEECGCLGCLSFLANRTAPSPSPVVEDDSVYVVNENGGIRISVTEEMVTAALASIWDDNGGILIRATMKAALVAALRVR